MYASALSLSSFRSWERLDLNLEPGISAFVGANGQGKTNLVEALGYLTTLGSHRVATDAPLIRAGAESATVQVAAVRDGRTTLVEIDIIPGRANRARVNRTPVPRPREVLGLVRSVLFAPEDLALVKGDPAERRRFIDDLLILRTPRFAGVRSDFDRVLKQRNALLKSSVHARRSGQLPEAALRTLDVWDGNLITLGAELLHGRLGVLDVLRPLLATAYEEVSDGNGPADIAYAAHDPAVAECLTNTRVPDRLSLEAALADALARRRPDELTRGLTLVGPQRDDLALRLGDLPAKGYASHGESWSFALALRLASFTALCNDDGIDAEPILILDDVFAELDAQRRARLADVASRAQQTIITAAVPADVPTQLGGAQFEVHGGKNGGQVTRRR
jgi:DNA replication and repair protein RecF